VGDRAQAEIARLGWGEALTTSAEHNRGVEALKEMILERLFEGAAPSPAAREEDASGEKLVRLGVYGRPNVGKSTLVNELLGAERMITSPIAGTTVDTVDTAFEREGRRYVILDTAGIRRKSKTEKGVEVLSVVQALKSVGSVDVALYLIDGYEGVTDQDEKVAGELVKAGKPVIMIVNKWDLCKVSREKYAERVRETLGFLDFAPVLFISAERGEGIEPLWELIDEILKQRFFVAPTGELNRFIETVEGTNNPTGVKLYYASQTSKNPPTITFMVSDPKKVHFAYERYLKNELRQRYGWMGSPIRLIFKARKRSESKRAR
jgi:GTP-binding protein